MDARSRTNVGSDATLGCTAPPATPPQSRFLPTAAPTPAAAAGTYRPPHLRAQSMQGPMARPSTESQGVARPRTAAPTPGARSQPKPTTLPSSASAPLPVPKATDRSKNDTTAYLYQGGITLVLSGGVMLGLKCE
ncbi:hypothetical protein DFH08DRAFT_970774 [Mycena albidolilacea]|uniref:Uncharacterized protein n=1 Tax=Mycena albidolilacea TaxID=1033008 RepID=A0AAD6ZEZ1_9AGAR|nr:hypothetical protein DFH08DRAFT_970774 [Mycena albidolilacea]